jgi:hypoxanthine phosphoribosyltransferase
MRMEIMLRAGGAAEASFRSGEVKGINPIRENVTHCQRPGALSGSAHHAMPPPNAATIHPDLESVLVSPARIKRRIKEMGREIRRVYGRDEFTVISIINGAIMFTADLLREIENPVRLDCIRISSYRNATKSLGTPQLIHSLTLDIAGRDVLLIDDILDTGKTLLLVTGLIRKLKPASLRTCVLLDKKGRREVNFEADFVGFRIPDKFVVGYGLDFAERYRNLPAIGVLKPARQNPPARA